MRTAIEYNTQLFWGLEEPPISGYVKLRRLQWEGHVTKMSEEGLAKRTLYIRTQETRPVGRHRDIGRYCRWRRADVAKLELDCSPVGDINLLDLTFQ